MWKSAVSGSKNTHICANLSYRRICIRKLIRRCVVLAAIVGVVLVEYDRNDKRWDKLDKILKLFPDAEEQETEVM